MYSDLFYILFVTSTNLVSPHFFHKFFSVSAVEKENKLFIGLKQFFFRFGPITTLFSFSTPQGEKNSWKKLRKARLVVWCHEQDIRQVEERKKMEVHLFYSESTNQVEIWNFRIPPFNVLLPRTTDFQSISLYVTFDISTS